jgi:hypothetical protein
VTSGNSFDLGIITITDSFTLDSTAIAWLDLYAEKNWRLLQQ